MAYTNLGLPMYVATYISSQRLSFVQEINKFI